MKSNHFGGNASLEVANSCSIAKFTIVVLTIGLNVLPCITHAQESKTLKDFLVDIGSSPVSASDLIGATGSAINNVQFPKDIWLALSPISDRTTKAGYGLAIAPARTSFLGMGGKAYFDNSFNRLWGGTSFSYAENISEYSGSTYSKQGFSVQASSYFKSEDDPIWIDYQGWQSCEERKRIEADIVKSKSESETNELMTKLQTATKKCGADNKKAKQSKWNAGKYSISYGSASIRPKSGVGQSLGLGDTLALSIVIPAGANGALNLSIRRVTKELDLSTIAGTPLYKKSSISAVRYTVGATEDNNLRLLAEISNANGAQSLQSNAVFKSALGIDWRIVDGAWLEFRLGRSKAIDNGSVETKGLLSFNISSNAVGFK